MPNTFPKRGSVTINQSRAVISASHPTPQTRLHLQTQRHSHHHTIHSRLRLRGGDPTGAFIREKRGSISVSRTTTGTPGFFMPTASSRRRLESNSKKDGKIDETSLINHCRVMATCRRCSGVMRWSWLSAPRSICTHFIFPVNLLVSGL